MGDFETTIPFTISFQDGREQILDEANFEDLVTKHFGSRTQLRKQVKQITWKQKSTLSQYVSETDTLQRSISDGDINPYGWRMKHR